MASRQCDERSLRRRRRSAGSLFMSSGGVEIRHFHFPEDVLTLVLVANAACEETNLERCYR